MAEDMEEGDGVGSVFSPPMPPAEQAADVGSASSTPQPLPPAEQAAGVEREAPEAPPMDELAAEEEEVKANEGGVAVVSEGGAVVEKAEMENEPKVKAEPSEGEATKPQVGDRVEVEWLTGQNRGVYQGVVDKTDLRISSQSRHGAAFEYRYHVKYDDGDKRWETFDDIGTRLAIIARAAAPSSSAGASGSVLSGRRAL